ncbi:myelin protein zero-like protein 1 [Garra rufa]|uniref:myelin protein zero-like protein 1 n=1 Tax=Garra rufa TaxID=137080 RepID=UPI003CCE79B6
MDNYALLGVSVVFVLAGVFGVSAIDVFTPAEVFVENGTTATLSCSFKSREEISSSASVTWSFLQEGDMGTPTSIFYYSGGKSFPGSVPQFKSRVEWAGDMNKKDASIRVTQMQFKDNGTFSCDVKNPPDISGQMSIIKVRVVPSEVKVGVTSRSVRNKSVFCAGGGIFLCAVFTMWRQ